MTGEDASLRVHVAGVVRQYGPLRPPLPDETVELPEEQIDLDEVVYRCASPVRGFGIQRGDYLIVKPRTDRDPTSCELVLGAVDERVFIGRWWEKRGRRGLLDQQCSALVEDAALRVLGSITLVVRIGR